MSWRVNRRQSATPIHSTPPLNGETGLGKWLSMNREKRRLGGVMAGGIHLEISGTRRIARVVMETAMAAAWI